MHLLRRPRSRKWRPPLAWFARYLLLSSSLSRLPRVSQPPDHSSGRKIPKKPNFASAPKAKPSKPLNAAPSTSSAAAAASSSSAPPQPRKVLKRKSDETSSSSAGGSANGEPAAKKARKEGDADKKGGSSSSDKPSEEKKGSKSEDDSSGLRNCLEPSQAFNTEHCVFCVDSSSDTDSETSSSSDNDDESEGESSFDDEDGTRKKRTGGKKNKVSLVTPERKMLGACVKSCVLTLCNRQLSRNRKSLVGSPHLKNSAKKATTTWRRFSTRKWCD